MYVEVVPLENMRDKVSYLSVPVLDSKSHWFYLYDYRAHLLRCDFPSSILLLALGDYEYSHSFSIPLFSISTLPQCALTKCQWASWYELERDYTLSYMCFGTSRWLQNHSYPWNEQSSWKKNSCQRVWRRRAMNWNAKWPKSCVSKSFPAFKVTQGHFFAKLLDRPQGRYKSYHISPFS